jgi:hypothetical protein
LRLGCLLQTDRLICVAKHAQIGRRSGQRWRCRIELNRRWGRRGNSDCSRRYAIGRIYGCLIRVQICSHMRMWQMIVLMMCVTVHTCTWLWRCLIGTCWRRVCRDHVAILMSIRRRCSRRCSWERSIRRWERSNTHTNQIVVGVCVVWSATIRGVCWRKAHWRFRFCDVLVCLFFSAFRNVSKMPSIDSKKISNIIAIPNNQFKWWNYNINTKSSLNIASKIN